MTPLPTPPEDYAALAEAHTLLPAIEQLLADAAALADLEDEPPGLHASYLFEAASLARGLTLALQTAGGRAQRRVEEAARQRGLDRCAGGCGQWLPKEQLVRRSSSSKAERASHWLSCVACGGPAEEALESPRQPASRQDSGGPVPE